MSDPAQVPEELQVLAGEYVLGVLDAAEMRAVRRRALADPAFAAVIAGWEQKLAPMAGVLPPLPPPDALWTRIEEAIAPLPLDAADDPLPARALPRVAPAAERPLVPRLRATAERAVPRPRLWPWQVISVASLAIAAGIAALVVLGPRYGVNLAFLGGAPVQVAALMPPDSHAPGFLVEARPNGTVVLTAMSTVEVPSGHDLELWILPPGGTAPAPLGVLPAAGRTLTLPHMPAAGTQLMISVEPPGGSTTGAPTGPVVYAGSLAQLTL
jgi:anti-sigma-K factor RskA